jgi:hypothetical protein
MKMSQEKLVVCYDDVGNWGAYALIKKLILRLEEVERKLSATDTAVSRLRLEIEKMKDTIPKEKVRR